MNNIGRIFFFIFTFLLGISTLLAQENTCPCVDCPGSILDGIEDVSKPKEQRSIHDFHLYIFNVLLDDLSHPSQCVEKVSVTFKHDFVGDVEMFLISPEGQEVQLIGPVSFGSMDGFSRTNTTSFEVNFVPARALSRPDANLEQRWHNEQDWAFSFGTRNGSYYPYFGDLEDFNLGKVNGSWTLRVVDGNPEGNDTGELEDFSIEFCNPTGLVCDPCKEEREAGEPCIFEVSGTEHQITPIESVCLDVITQNVAFVEHLKWSMTWEPTVMKYNNIQNIVSTSGITLSDFDFRGGFIDLDYTVPANDTLGLVLADSTVLFQICFSAVGEEGDSTLFTFSNVEVNVVGDSMMMTTNVPGKVNLTVDLSADCGTAKQLCGMESISVARTEGPGFVKEEGDATSCWNEAAETQSKWYQFDILSAGSVDFVIQPKANAGFRFLVFKGTCGSQAIECFSGGSGSDRAIGVSDDSNATFGVEGKFAPSINAVAGEQYYLVVDNKDDNGVGFDLQFAGTAVIGDATLTAVIENPPILNCTRPTITLNTAGTSDGEKYSYEWDIEEGRFLDSLDLLAPILDKSGMYTLKVRDTKTRCATKAMVLVEDDFDFPTASIKEGFTLNCTQPDFVLDGSASSNGQEFRYNWTSDEGNIVDNQNAESAKVDQAGLYILEVTNSTNNCVSRDTVEVLSDFIAPNLSVEDATLTCREDTLFSTASTASDVVVVWESDQLAQAITAKTIEITTPGLYRLTATAPNGCTTPDQVMIADDQMDPTADAGAPTTLSCQQPEYILQGDSSSKAEEIAYAWRTVGGQFTASADINSLNPSINKEGTYILKVENIRNGCFVEDTVLIEKDFVLPTIQINADTLITCLQENIVLDASASDSGAIYDFRWLPKEGGNIVIGENTYQPRIDRGGTFILEITNTTTGCVIQDSVFVQESIDRPNLITTDSSITCFRTALTLSARTDTAGVFMEWSSDLLPSPVLGTSLDIDTPGIYEVKATAPNGCSTFKTVRIADDRDLPDLQVPKDSILTCIVTSIDLVATSVTPETNLFWTNPNGDTLMLDSIQAMIPGVYSNTAIAKNGCQLTKTVRIDNDENLPIALIDSTTQITCDSIVAILDATKSSTGDEFSYIWETEDGEFENTASTTALTTQVVSGGVYQLTIIDNSNQCQITNAIKVKDIRQEPTIFFNHATELTLTCVDKTLQLSANTSADRPLYRWTLDGEVLSESEEKDFTASKTGEYRLVIKDLDNNCSRLGSVTVGIDTIAPIANAGVSQELNCTTGSVTLDGSASSQGEFSYIWTNEQAQTVGTEMRTDVSEPGLYNLDVVSLATGCRKRADVEITASLDNPVANAGADTVYCKDILELELELGTSLSSQGNQYLYQWRDALANPLGTELKQTIFTGGLFILEVTNTSNNCTAIDTINVSERPRPTISLRKDGAINCRDNSLRYTASSDLPNTTIVWDGDEVFPDSILTATDALLGKVYVAKGTNNETGCKGFSDFIEIEADRAAPIVNPGKTDSINCKDLVLLDGSFSSKGAQFSYTWSTEAGNIIGSTDSIMAQVDQPGHYILSIFNKNNFCSNSDTVLIKDNTTPPSIYLGPDRFLTCSETNIDLLADSASLDIGGSIYYSWSNANNQELAMTATLSNIDSAGVYQLQAIDSLNFCVNFDTVEIFRKDTLPIVNIAEAASLDCRLPSTQLAANTLTDGIYTWQTADGNIQVGDSTLTPTIDAGGTYILSVIDPANDCVATDSILVVDNQKQPLIDAGENTLITCYNDSLAVLTGTILEENLALVLEWTTSNSEISLTANTLNLTVEEAATYYLTAIDTVTACIATDSVVVTANQESFGFSLPIDEATIDCNTPELPIGDARLPENDTLDYKWTTNNGKIVGSDNSKNTLVAAAGEYTLTVLNVLNGCSSKDRVVVAAGIDLPQVDAGIAQTLTCAARELQIGSQNTAAGDGLTYTWTTEDGQITAGANTQFATINQAGTYELLVVNDTTGCQQVSSVNISENLAIEGIILPEDKSVDCKDTIIQLALTGAIDQADLVYNWSTNNGQITTNVQESFVVVNQPGTYFVEIIETASACTILDSIVVGNEQTLPIANAGEDKLLRCDEPNIILSADGSSTGEAITYLWRNEQGDILARAANTTVSRPGKYSLLVKNEKNACQSKAVVEILANTEMPRDAALSLQQPSCENSANASIRVDSIIGGIQPLNIQLDGLNISANNSYNNLEPGEYLLSVEDAQGCQWDSTLVIEAPEALEVAIIASTNNLIAGESVQLSVGGTVNPNTIDVINWTPNTVFNCSDCLDQTLALNTPTEIGLFIIDDNGCEGSASIFVDVTLAEVPNAITPNGDGSNDVFTIPILESDPTGHPDNEIIIFNRWGDVVYQASPYNNDWAGTHKGQQLPEGTYYFVLRLDISEGEIMKGKVTILK